MSAPCAPGEALLEAMLFRRANRQTPGEPDKNEDCKINPNSVKPRQRCWTQRHQHVDAELGQEQTEHSTHTRQHDALGQQFLNQTEPAPAQGGPKREFSAPPGGSHADLLSIWPTWLFVTGR